MEFTSEQIKELTTKMSELIMTFGMDVIGAITILILGWWFSKWAQKSIRKMLDRTQRVDATLKPLISSVVRYAILIFVIIAVLAQFGVQTASIITVLGAAGLAIGLALQGTLSNIAAGVMILLLRPIKVDEYIDSKGSGVAGSVMEIGLFTTILKTFDGVFVSVPNSEIWNAAITNYSRNPTRRLDLPVGISYSDDVKKGMQVLSKLLKDARVLNDPEAQVMVTQLGDSSVVINLRCWVSKDDYWSVLFDFTRDAKLELDKAGISIPFPQRDVHFYDVAAANKNKKPAKSSSKTKKKSA